MEMTGDGGGRPTKKQKFERTIAMEPGVGLSRFTKHLINYTPDLSPGALHSNRVAIHVSVHQ